MTTAVAPAPRPPVPGDPRPAPPPVSGPPPPKRRRRWLAFAVPFGLLLLIWAITAVAHITEQINPSNPDTLSPTGTGYDGSSRLAQLLTAQGVRIERVTTPDAALRAVSGLDATVFVPTPGYVPSNFLFRLEAESGEHRAVVVAPGGFSGLLNYTPIIWGPSRWASTTVEPGCTVPYAVQAGRAAALRSRYAVLPEHNPFTVTANCYGGGLVGVRHDDLEILAVGASDPFRNGRIDESGNAALAVGLLREHSRLVWLDMHAREPVNISVGRPSLEAPNLPSYRRDEASRGETGFPTIDAFPPTMWALFVLAALFFVVLAVARGRRLGTPVPEPLPVLVPAAESVTGRGRLYERIGARAATLDTLRAAAITRIARVLNPFGGPAPERDVLRPGAPGDALVTRIAERTGFVESTVHTALYGAAPDSDEQLSAAVTMLDSVVQAVLRDDTTGRGGTP